MPYLLDANVFIEAKNRYYGFDFCPAFWDWLISSNEQGRVYSIDKVGKELKERVDELSQWVDTHGEGFFLKPDEQIFPAYGKVSNWVNEQDYEQAAVNTFLQDADYYLVAHALAYEHTVVTHELPSNSRKKIKIPDVCEGLEIEYSNTFEMLRLERARFVLGG